MASMALPLATRLSTASTASLDDPDTMMLSEMGGITQRDIWLCPEMEIWDRTGLYDLGWKTTQHLLDLKCFSLSHMKHFAALT